jgi:hypothetical protein
VWFMGQPILKSSGLGMVPSISHSLAAGEITLRASR